MTHHRVDIFFFFAKSVSNETISIKKKKKKRKELAESNGVVSPKMKTQNSSLMIRHHFNCIFLPLQLCLYLPFCLSTSQQPITTTYCSIPYQPNQQNLSKHHPKLKPPPQLATPPTTIAIITTNTLPPFHTQQQPPKHINIKSTTTATTT